MLYFNRLSYSSTKKKADKRLKKKKNLPEQQYNLTLLTYWNKKCTHEQQKNTSEVNVTSRKTQQMWIPFRNVHIRSTMWYFILNLSRVWYQFCREVWFVITVIFQFAHISKRSAKNHSSSVYLHGSLGLTNSVGVMYH